MSNNNRCIKFKDGSQITFSSNEAFINFLKRLGFASNIQVYKDALETEFISNLKRLNEETDEAALTKLTKKIKDTVKKHVDSVRYKSFDFFKQQDYTETEATRVLNKLFDEAGLPLDKEYYTDKTDTDQTAKNLFKNKALYPYRIHLARFNARQVDTEYTDAKGKTTQKSIVLRVNPTEIQETTKFTNKKSVEHDQFTFSYANDPLNKPDVYDVITSSYATKYKNSIFKYQGELYGILSVGEGTVKAIQITSNGRLLTNSKANGNKAFNEDDLNSFFNSRRTKTKRTFTESKEDINEKDGSKTPVLSIDNLIMLGVVNKYCN